MIIFWRIMALFWGFCAAMDVQAGDWLWVGIDTVFALAAIGFAVNEGDKA